jgi:lipopolysaccharide/colanic/teichoic acid biosynthesis glycosyltransferase
MSSVALDHHSAVRQRRAALVIYRGLDIAIAAAALLACAPVFLIASIAIRLDSAGPAVFRQRRLGRAKQPFTVHKFRTMNVQADSR